MKDPEGSDIDRGTAHLRPGQRPEARPVAEPDEVSAESIPWEGSRDGGSRAAFVATLWQFVSAPKAAYAKVPVRGGAWRPWSFALLCAVGFGVVRQLIDVATVAMLSYGGANDLVPELFRFEVAGRSLEWLPISVVSVAGCLLALGIGAPLYLLSFCLVTIVWITIVERPICDRASVPSRGRWRRQTRCPPRASPGRGRGMVAARQHSSPRCGDSSVPPQRPTPRCRCAAVPGGRGRSRCFVLSGSASSGS